MKMIAFIIAVLLFALGVYFIVKTDYLLGGVLMVTMIAWLQLIDHSPTQ